MMHFANSLLCCLTSMAVVQCLEPAPEAFQILEIEQTIDLFAILIDGHQYSKLDSVFFSEATANFNLPGGEILNGLPAISGELSKLANVTSQHGFTTRYVSLTGLTSANVTSYFLGLFFGRASQTGQIFTEYGM